MKLWSAYYMFMKYNLILFDSSYLGTILQPEQVNTKETI